MTVKTSWKRIIQVCIKKKIKKFLIMNIFPVYWRVLCELSLFNHFIPSTLSFSSLLFSWNQNASISYYTLLKQFYSASEMPCFKLCIIIKQSNFIKLCVKDRYHGVGRNHNGQIRNWYIIFDVLTKCYRGLIPFMV